MSKNKTTILIILLLLLFLVNKDEEYKQVANLTIVPTSEKPLIAISDSMKQIRMSSEHTKFLPYYINTDPIPNDVRKVNYL